MNKKSLYQILFPFYAKERYGFIFQKWWGRLLLVLYIIGIIAVIIFSYNWLAHHYWGNCLVRIKMYKALNLAPINDACYQILEQFRTRALGFTVLIAVAAHYLSQLIFFKLIIDFIAWGNKK